MLFSPGRTALLRSLIASGLGLTSAVRWPRRHGLAAVGAPFRSAKQHRRSQDRAALTQAEQPGGRLVGFWSSRAAPGLEPSGSSGGFADTGATGAETCSRLSSRSAPIDRSGTVSLSAPCSAAAAGLQPGARRALGRARLSAIAQRRSPWTRRTPCEDGTLQWWTCFNLTRAR